MATDNSEKGLETIIVRHMTGTDDLSNPDAKFGRVSVTPKDFGDFIRGWVAFLRESQVNELAELHLVV